MDFMNYVFLAGGLFAFFGLVFLLAVNLRRVVATNEVHIVQSAKRTTSYGKDTGNGNTYYEWPAWLPVFGITRIKLPTNNFTLILKEYEAYDKGRLPFLVDIAAFFRIKDSNVAAQRISSHADLLEQLKQIVQGAVRTILASSDIEQIMQGRSTFGEQFTKEVTEQLAQWGVETVKNMELMDIHDATGSNVIKNIMEKKKSQIDMESRTEVAKNRQLAETAEISAKRETDLRDQEAKQAVGLRTIETQRAVSISQQNALQTVKEQERATKEKEMNILQVEQLRKAEIEKTVQVVKAQQNAETTVLVAKGQKETLVLQSEGQLEAKRREAEGITLEGNAKAEAEKAMQLAPVQAQIVLAQEIGGNKEYQQYLITIRQVEAAQAVGMAQAGALAEADVKIISNTGNPVEGVTNVLDLFSSKGGTQVGSMLEALANTDAGAKLLEQVTGPKTA